LLIAEVSDTGHGIRPSDFKRLFQPYFSTRGGGTGLGLAIVQRIILEHGGRIRAEANYPRGARFVIELQATTDDGRPATAERRGTPTKDEESRKTDDR
jgi:signal transduction histidine kinase